LDYLKAILNATVYDIVIETPLDYLSGISSRFNNQIFLKREDLQPVFSFKIRGAYNKILHAYKTGLYQNVVAASAGNHAQGVALSCQRLGIKSTIVMPKTTPAIKVSAVEKFGGNILLHGDTYDEAAQYALSLAREKQTLFVHPYDDPLVIAGQGTIAREILHQKKNDIQAVFVPVGGGGLIAGIGVYIKSLRPDISVIGVEPVDAPTLYTSLREKKRIKLEHVGLFTDGVAVKQLGKEPFRLAKDCVDEVVLVSIDEICAAIKDIFDNTRSIAEPAGALAIAGMKRYIREKKLKNCSLVAINSGANINFDRLRHVAERAELGQQKEALIAVTIPEEPGSFQSFCNCLGSRSITEFNYRYADRQKAHIFVGIELRIEHKDKQFLIKTLQSKDFPVLDLSNNEIAKLHIRYMVGGRAPHLKNEKIYRFQFPECPGALSKFLNHMQNTQTSKKWNITLFHYRNHGAAYGRVFVGIQVSDEDRQAFQDFLDHLGYPYFDENNNPAYSLFLS